LTLPPFAAEDVAPGGIPMSLSELTDPQAVLRAIAEFDEIGRGDFLAKYGFKEARHYFVVHDGKRYDSKAIAGAAHGFQFPAEGALKAAEFNGAEQHAVFELRELGFEDETRSLITRVARRKSITAHFAALPFLAISNGENDV
jgi:hypothetical protein